MAEGKITMEDSKPDSPYCHTSGLEHGSPAAGVQQDSNPEQHLNQHFRVRAKNIPQDLKDHPQWVAYKAIEKPDGKTDKEPYQPRVPEEKASTTDSSTWGTFEEAMQVLEENPRFDGIGYVISEDDPFVGFDYDDCISGDGELHEIVSRQVDDLDGYTEISPSGKGLRVFVRAKKPGPSCSTKKTPWGAEFAMYEHSRYLTITGQALRNHTQIREAQEAVDRAYHEFFPEEKEAPPRSEGRGNDLSDEELIDLACRSENGDRFRRHHYDGDTSGYGSRSEADFAHLADLCFWTGRDEERMVDLFSRSALYLPEKGMRYVSRSARKAIRTHRGGYYEGTKKDTDPEILGRVEEIEKWWWDEQFPGIGGKTDASILRALVRTGKRVGTVTEDGDLRVSISVRDLAEIASCHVNTILNFTKRAEEAGYLRKDKTRTQEEDSAAFVLLARPTCDTHKDTPNRVIGSVTTESRYPVADLTTEHYKWRGHVGKGRERTLCASEAFGPQHEDELAERLGWSRARDLRARHLKPLTELGLMEDRGDGVWAIAGDSRDYAERQERVKEIPYSTNQLRAKRVRSVEGLKMTVVEESGCVASEKARKEADIERNKHQREMFHRWLAERRKAAKEREAARSMTPPTAQVPEPEPEPEPEPVEFSWPEVVDGVVVHHPECGCSFCVDEPEEAA